MIHYSCCVGCNDGWLPAADADDDADNDNDGDVF